MQAIESGAGMVYNTNRWQCEKTWLTVAVMKTAYAQFCVPSALPRVRDCTDRARMRIQIGHLWQQ